VAFLHENLRKLYRNKKFSITQLALVMDKSRRSISEWLHNGRAICLSIDNVENYRSFINELSFSESENENEEN
jgi:hypothetical protein